MCDRMSARIATSLRSTGSDATWVPPFGCGYHITGWLLEEFLHPKLGQVGTRISESDSIRAHPFRLRDAGRRHRRPDGERLLVQVRFRRSALASPHCQRIINSCKEVIVMVEPVSSVRSQTDPGWQFQRLVNNWQQQLSSMAPFNAPPPVPEAEPKTLSTAQFSTSFPPTHPATRSPEVPERKNNIAK